MEVDPVTGEPTGLLRSLGHNVKARTSAKTATEEDVYRRTVELFRAYNEVGLTTVADRDSSLERVAAYEKLLLTGDLTVRMRVSPGVLAGEVDDAGLDGFYDSADIFVMPSLYEGYGMVLGEAMARGLPIVTTTGGAAAQTVPDGAALKVGPGDPVALTDALARLISDSALRSSLSQAAFAAGQALPSWDDTARIVAGVLARVAEGTGA
jgi:glycosyltransferase involved in cell wall biosynthesis